jgi:hypothetical protein
MREGSIMTEKEPLKITLADLGEPELPPAQPAIERHSRVREEAGELGQKVVGSVKEAGNRVAHKIADTTADAATRSAEAVRDKVNETVQAQSKATAEAIEARLREIDWKSELQKGAQGGLHWLSARLEELAQRLRADEKDSKQ